SVPQLQLAPEILIHAPAAAPIPGVLSGGAFPNRWLPSSARSAPAGAVDEALAHAEGASTQPEIRPLIPLGQFRDTFIIAIDDEGVAIVDQHVAHERVLFERVMERLTSGRLEAQRLLVPLVLDFSPSAHQALTARAAELERFGFEIES